MIREITGMLVTAIAIANTSRNAVSLPAAPWSSEEIDELEHAEPDREQEQHAGERDQRGGLALATMEDRAQLGAGNEHQQEQPELVDRAEHGRGRAVRLWEHLRLHLRERRAEDRQAEHQAAEDLADHQRLAKAREQVAAGVGRDHEQPEAEYQARDFSAGR